MKIAVVTTSYPSAPGDAAGHFVEAEARALAAQGHDVHVLSPFARVQDEHRLRHVQVRGSGLFGWPGALERLKQAPWKAPGALAFAASVQATLTTLGPWDAIIAHWIVPSAWPSALGHAPLTVVAHGSDVRLLRALPRPVSRRILGQLVAQGASFRCVSEALRRDLVELCPKLAARARVAPCALSLDRVPTRDSARSSLDVRDRLVVFVGRVIPSKRLDIGLGAAELLSDVDIVVVGDGPCMEELRQRHPRARFLGRLSHVETLRWIAAADLLISSSLDEGAPTAVREAVALGVDVVACPSGDLAAWARSEPLLWVTRNLAEQHDGPPGDASSQTR
ncbi:MAG TPA: glycosyltransferase family 4 protein [Polyangiaceae bacterium]